MRAIICITAVLCSCGSPAAPARPDVVLIVVDTLRADVLTAYGHHRESSPFLTGLAREGIVFERTWSTSSWTAPATASIFTGVYPDHHGVQVGLQVTEGQGLEQGLNRIPPELETLPELFTRGGYRTYAVADNPNLCEPMGFTRGFGRFEGGDYEGAGAVNEKLARWAEEIRSSSEPTFVYLHYMDPHAPYHEREPYYGEVLAAEPDVQPEWAAYESEVRYLDDALREAFELLDVGPETLVMFTADHGEEFGDHGHRRHGFYLYDELTRVPWIVLLPGRPHAGRRVAEGVSTVDLLPTLAELCALEDDLSRGGREGASLAATLTRGEAPPDRDLFSMRLRISDGSSKSAIVRANRKAIFARPEGSPLVFDLDSDPQEQENLAGAEPELTGELQRDLERFEARRIPVEPSFVEIELSAEDEAMLEGLGYTGDE